MPRPLLASLILAPLLACGDSGGGSESGSATSTATTGLPGATTGEPSTTDTTTTTTATSEPPTTGDDSTTTAAPTTGDDSSTGEPAFCNGWQTAGGEPFLELYNKPHEKLADGSTLPLECGAQGLFMFGLYAQFGGFTPAGEIVDFAVTVDVDGFNDNPDGHFYSADPVGYYVGCQPLDGGLPGFVPVFPGDNLENLAMLDGKPASVHVEMRTGQETVVVDLEVVLSVTQDDSWKICGG